MRSFKEWLARKIAWDFSRLSITAKTISKEGSFLWSYSFRAQFSKKLESDGLGLVAWRRVFWRGFYEFNESSKEYKCQVKTIYLL